MGNPVHDQPTAAGALTRGFLYDAAGRDREVDVTADAIAQLHDRAILWIDISRRDDGEIQRVGELLQLDAAATAELTTPGARLPLDNYGTYLHFAGLGAPGSDRTAAPGDARERQRALRIDFVVGRNWLLTLHDREPGYLKAFREQDKGDTGTGALSAAALTASLLDWHLEGYFAEVSRIEAAVDQIDERVLAEPSEEKLLEAILAIRRRISRLRRTLIAQRSVFYGLSRPDLDQVADGGMSEAFSALPGRFERAVDEVEHTRDLIVGSFELFTSRSAQQTNDLVRALTFFTVIIGTTAAVAGLFGMNFDPPFFQTGSIGFFAVTLGLLILGLSAWCIGKRRRWI
jgi:magnesium transporter